MQQPIGHRVQMAVLCIVGLVLMVLVTACAGVGSTSTGGAITIRGTLISVNTSQHSATVNVNGQQVTVSGLTDQQVADLQPQVGKTYSLQVTGSGNSYTIVPNSTLQPSETNTPAPNATPIGPPNGPHRPWRAGIPAGGRLPLITAPRSVPDGSGQPMPNGSSIG